MANTFTTKSGDTFDSIAFQLFGHARYTRELMEANSNHLETVIFSAGTVLNVPEITPEDTTAAGEPPWRQ